MSLAELIPKVLVANRGEIALRIIRTCRKLGIQTVAIYHDIDRNSPSVQLADEACEIVGDTPTGAYLDIAQIVRIAAEHHVSAVHPGYGFLAENSLFAAAVADAGIRFVGPSPDVIRLLGDKVEAREFVKQHNVQLAPSTSGDGSEAELLEQASAIGFPILIKAAAGGGGKGMHIVYGQDEFQPAYALATSEALRYFGDSRVYCEKYLARPRHIEVQILADEQGNCVHLGERECSVQRRFQKVFEESPAPGLSADLRQRMCDTAVTIASAANYTNAGTVEFILGEDGEFYFLEMNTRLQVEHPVTEMVTGIDLVEAQLHVTAGDPLAFRQDQITHSGHAIEMRICAEDAEADFMPAVGKVQVLRNAEGDGVRLDSGLAEGMMVTSAFDPMLAKLIAHGADRESAIDIAHRAIREQVILGVTTNCGFLGRVLAHPAFRAGAIHTHFIDEHRDELRRPALNKKQATELVVMAAFNDPEFQRLTFNTPQPHAAMGAWRNA
ncbi:MAG: acetyl/propionyl-CoA carboxylase alpha subunit [Gammaproteobacteria bacterium]|jgi:acetyl/propionyl-CoA carboxylase alpha subunit